MNNHEIWIRASCVIAGALAICGTAHALPAEAHARIFDYKVTLVDLLPGDNLAPSARFYQTGTVTEGRGPVLQGAELNFSSPGNDSRQAVQENFAGSPSRLISFGGVTVGQGYSDAGTWSSSSEAMARVVIDADDVMSFAPDAMASGRAWLIAADGKSGSLTLGAGTLMYLTGTYELSARVDLTGVAGDAAEASFGISLFSDDGILRQSASVSDHMSMVSDQLVADNSGASGPFVRRAPFALSIANMGTGLMLASVKFSLDAQVSMASPTAPVPEPGTLPLAISGGMFGVLLAMKSWSGKRRR